MGGNVYESAPKPVKSKQQSLELGADFDCPIADEWLTIRTPPEDGSPSTAIPVIVRLNRKGLIDSEPIAWGKILLPLESTAMDNISVGLSPDDASAEIAIVKLSVQISLARNDRSTLAAIVEDIETLMIQYARGRMTGTVISESLQQYLSSVTPLRRLIDAITDLVTWKSSYSHSWLFLLSVLTLPPYGLFVTLLVLTCNAVERPLPIVRFIPSQFPHAKQTTEESLEHCVELNLLFLSHWLDRISRLSRMIVSTRTEMLMAASLLVYLLPAHLLILTVMAYNTFALQGVIAYLLRKHRMRSQKPLPDSGQVAIFENQRWWLGKWSDKLIGNESHPWTDGEGNAVNKESFVPLSGCEWSAKWSIDNPEGDPEGWSYGREFATGTLNVKRELADFVRTRRWVRNYRQTNITAS